jgi:hypothetical protein
MHDDKDHARSDQPQPAVVPLTHAASTEAIQQARDAACSLLCPSVKKDGEAWTHTEPCRALSEHFAACAPYIKDEETPAECIERNRSDTDAVMALLARALKRAEVAEAQLSRIGSGNHDTALLRAAKALRAAQRDYMADRGNNEKGAIVAEAAKQLDAAIAGSEALLPADPSAAVSPEPQQDDLAERVTYWANILDRCIDVDYLIDAQSARMILREMREFAERLPSPPSGAEEQ